MILSFDADAEKSVMSQRSRWLLLVEGIEATSTTIDFGANKMASHAAKLSSAVELTER